MTFSASGKNERMEGLDYSVVFILKLRLSKISFSRYKYDLTASTLKLHLLV
jgi:hypothetical protein